METTCFQPLPPNLIANIDEKRGVQKRTKCVQNNLWHQSKIKIFKGGGERHISNSPNLIANKGKMKGEQDFCLLYENSLNVYKIMTDFTRITFFQWGKRPL